MKRCQWLSKAFVEKDSNNVWPQHAIQTMQCFYAGTKLNNVMSTQTLSLIITEYSF